VQDESDLASVAELQRALREDFGLRIPFTAEEFRTALDRVRARRGMRPGELPPLRCTCRQPDGTFVIPVPRELSPAEQEHLKYHQLAHIVLKHAQSGKTHYTTREERDAEAFADAMMAQGLGTSAIE
jgi:hypothetical protein